MHDLVAAFHAHFTSDPNACVSLGIEARLDELPDPSLEANAATARGAADLAARMRAHPRDGLSFDDALDLDLAILALERDHHDRTYTLEGVVQGARMPRAGDDIGDGVFLMFVNDPRPAADRLADITARLEAAPDYLEACLAGLDTPVKRWVDIDLEKIEGLPSLLDTLVAWGQTEGFADQARLERARAATVDAMTAYATALRAMPTTTALHVGRPTAERIVATRGVEQSLETLHGYARRFLADNAATLAELRDRLVPRYGLPADTTVDGLHTFLNHRYRVDVPVDHLEGVLDRYRAEHGKILAFIRERDLFPIPADQELSILRTPAFMAPSIPAGAMMPPPPFRAGTARSMVYLTLSADLLDEHTALGIPGMMIHEGIPGHHLQLATAARHASIVRKHFDANDLAEGWTTMLEDYMLDLGYMGDLTDEARFVGKLDIARIGARVAIDLFFMTGDRGFLDVGVSAEVSSPDPYEAAGNLLRAVTGFTPGRVQAELNWYSQERGYPLSYLTGNTLVWQLKRDVTEARRGQLEGLDLDRAFHRTYLEAGNMPVAFLRRVFAHEGLL